MIRSAIVCAACLFATGAWAQPKVKWAKKAAKSLVEVVTHDKDGLVLQRRTGFVTSSDGRVLSTYENLPGAASVEVVTADGKTYQPQRVLAADAMLDFVLFTTDIKKPAALATGSGEVKNVFVLDAKRCQADSIVKVEDVKGQPYYTLSRGVDVLPGSPMLNSEGEVLGMVHLADEKGAYAVSMGTVLETSPSAMAVAGRTYASLPIPVQLPADEDKARTFLFLSQSADSARYLTHVEDYISAFPTQAYGYSSKGEYLLLHGNLEAAATAYAEGAKQVETPAELLYSRSNAMYKYALSVADTTLLPQALTLVDDAISADCQPIYQNHRANVFYSLRRYHEAAADFEALSQTTMRSAQAFAYASQCHRMAGDSLGVVLALLDSAMVCYPTPLPVEAANTVLLRATTRAEAAMWRPAVQDYNDYEHLCGGNVNAEFYYRRFIAEANGRLFQQGLDDLDRAIALMPDNAELHAQKALFLYRLGQPEEAISEAQRAIELDAEWKEDLKIIFGEN